MPLNLEAIKALCEKATSPPWVFNPKATGGEVQPSLASHAESLGDLAPMPITTGTPFWSDSDFHFIAHARTDLPALVAEVERLKADLAAVREALAGEREALTAAQRSLANISGCGGCENCGDIASRAFAVIDARRAAESKDHLTGGGEMVGEKACPDCSGTGVRVKYHGGSIGNPNVIGLAMESYPCWCRAAESKAAKEET